MPARRVSRRSGRAGRQTSRRPTTWENIIIQHAHGTVGEEVVTDLTVEPMGTSLVGTATLIRSIIRLQWNKDTSGVATAIQQLAIGITVMTNDAFAGLVVPDPLSDFQQDWYYWQALGTAWNINGEAVVVEADIRSARRLRGGFKLVLITESPASNSLDTELWMTMRNLWKTP